MLRLKPLLTYLEQVSLVTKPSSNVYLCQVLQRSRNVRRILQMKNSAGLGTQIVALLAQQESNVKQTCAVEQQLSQLLQETRHLKELLRHANSLLRRHTTIHQMLVVLKAGDRKSVV